MHTRSTIVDDLNLWVRSQSHKKLESLYATNSERRVCGFGVACGSMSCHAPNPKGSKAWERRLKVLIDFSFSTIQSTKIISSTKIKNYHNNSVEYTLKVSQSSKQ